MYKDIKKNTSEEGKNYTVNTLVYSYNSICNTNETKGCEKKLKFIQNMLSYMDKNDRTKILGNRNVMHINYDTMFDKEKQIANFERKKDINERDLEKAEISLENASVTSLEEEFSTIKPKSPANSQEKSKIYPHYTGKEKLSINSHKFKIFS